MQVDFYILEAGSEQESLRTTCRLADKAYRTGHRVFVHTDSREAARRVDDLLWTFRQESFLPHGLAPSPGFTDPANLDPVLVGDGTTPSIPIDVLINLSQDVPLFVEKSSRVAEIVGGAEQARQAGRARYRIYRDRGFVIKQHDLRTPE